MKGMIRADYYMMKSTLKVVLITFGLFSIFSIFLKSPLYIITMQSMYAIMILISMMSMDENGRDAYYQQLPFDRKELVKEKYVRGFLFLVPFLLASDVEGFIITLVLKLDFMDFFSQAVLGIAYFLLAMDISIPVLIKHGATMKSRMLCMLFILLPSTLLISFTGTFIKDKPGMDFDSTATVLMLGASALAVLFLPLSYRLSVKYYQEKEF